MFWKALLAVAISSASDAKESWTSYINKYGQMSPGLEIQSSFYIEDSDSDNDDRIVVILTNVPDGCAVYRAGLIKRQMFAYQIEVASPKSTPSYAWDSPTLLAHGYYVQLDDQCRKQTSWHADRGSVSIDQFPEKEGEKVVGRFALYNQNDLFFGEFNASRCEAISKEESRNWVCK